MIFVYYFMDPRETTSEATVQAQLDNLLREKQFLLQEVTRDIEKLCQQLKQKH